MFMIGYSKSSRGKNVSKCVFRSWLFFLCYVGISENDFFSIIYVLCHKNLTPAEIRKMRHASLGRNVIKVFLKFHILIQNG